MALVKISKSVEKVIEKVMGKGAKAAANTAEEAVKVAAHNGRRLGKVFVGAKKITLKEAKQRIQVGEFLGRAKKASKARRLIPGNPGVVTGGSSTKLGKNMMEKMGLKRSQKWTGYQSQHIIPSQMKKNPVIQKIGMDFDNASNGVFLRVPDNDISTMARHQGYHSVYNEVVERALNNMDINQSVDVLQRQVFNLQKNLRYLQEKGLPLYPNQGATVELWERKLSQLMN